MQSLSIMNHLKVVDMCKDLDEWRSPTSKGLKSKLESQLTQTNTKRPHFQNFSSVLISIDLCLNKRLLVNDKRNKI